MKKKIIQALISSCLIITMGCSDNRDEKIIQEVWWVNNYFVVNELSYDIVVTSYLKQLFNNKILVDTIEANNSTKIHELGGIGANENLLLNSVFDSLKVQNMATKAFIYETDFSSTNDWEVVEVTPEITVNYKLTFK